jgi:hypothetical protein
MSLAFWLEAPIKKQFFNFTFLPLILTSTKKKIQKRIEIRFARVSFSVAHEKCIFSRVEKKELHDACFTRFSPCRSFDDIRARI